jgi:2,5-diketo-D-gluconate reductase B
MAALDIELEQADMDAIEALNRNERIADPDFAPNWD